MTDDLARIIDDAQREWHDWLDPTVALNEHIATAVRSYLLSGERVEAAAEECWHDEFARATGRRRLVPWSEAGEGEHVRWRRIALAALAAAIGEDGR